MISRWAKRKGFAAAINHDLNNMVLDLEAVAKKGVSQSSEVVGPSAISVLEGVRSNEVSLQELRNPAASVGKLVDTMSVDRPPLRRIEGLNSPKSLETSGTEKQRKFIHMAHVRWEEEYHFEKLWGEATHVR
ncbi:hypothetical protein Tco_0267008 [Tanacetum coccineum]